MQEAYKRKKSRCQVENCNRDVNTSMHSAPSSNKELRSKWMKALNLSPFHKGYVYACGNHFKESDFTKFRDNRINVRLRRNAVPSINIPNENSLTNSETTSLPENDEFICDEKWNLQESLKTMDMPNSIMPGAAFVKREVINKCTSPSTEDFRPEESGEIPTNESFISDEKWNLQEYLKTMDMRVDIPNSRMPNAAFVSNEVINKVINKVSVDGTSVLNEDLRPQKSGEIFRDIRGKFSFMCTFCNIFYDDCNEIMDHINSHFDQSKSFTHEPIEEASPEFISVDELEPETTNLETKIIANDIFQTNTMSQPKLINPPKILKLKIEMPTPHECETNVRSEVRHTSDKSKIVRIVKLKPIKFRPHKVYGAGKNQMLSKVNQINCLTKPTDIPSEIKLECTQSETEENIVTSPTVELDLRSSKENHSENKRPVNMRQSNSKCYQCEMEAKINDPLVPKRHICHICTTWFSNHKELEIHCKEMHKKNANNIECNNFYCFVCQKEFTRRNNLADHLKIHYLNKAFLCSTCGQKFTSTARLEIHMKTHEEPTLECYECGKKFVLFKNLRSHFWCHNKELPFACKICSKAFKAKRYLKSHMALHSEVKIKCRYCDAIFNFKSVRRVHERSHHNVF